MEKINLHQKFNLFNEHWSPKIIGELNGQHVKLVKLLGEFTWHHHQNEDELFYVIKGILKMEMEDKTLELQPGEICIIPRGMEHRPVAEEEVWVMLFEPAGTLNTGNTETQLTKKELQHI